MKKVFTFLALLLAFAGTTSVSAQISSLDNLSENAYYQIKCIQSGLTKCYVSSESNTAGTDGGYSTDQYIKRTDGTTIVPTLWQIEKGSSDNMYKFKNANSGKYWGAFVEASVDWSNTKQPSDGIKMVNTDSEAGQYAILQYSESSSTWLIAKENVSSLSSARDYVNAIGGNGIAEGYEYLADCGDEYSKEGNWWQIIPVTKFSFTINTETHWASAKFPFGVKLPSGVNAYVATTVSGDGTSVELKNITNEVPANTAVFILDNTTEKTGTYSIEIKTDAFNASTSGNLLEGTTLSRTGYSEGDLYMLTRDGSTPVLKKNSSNLTTIAPNKAFLPAKDVPASAQSLAFSFGESTGVEGVAAPAPASDEKYYDLNGRQVLYPVAGVYVTSKGQKVYIK